MSHADAANKLMLLIANGATVAFFTKRPAGSSTVETDVAFSFTVLATEDMEQSHLW